MTHIKSNTNSHAVKSAVSLFKIGALGETWSLQKVVICATQAWSAADTSGCPAQHQRLFSLLCFNSLYRLSYLHGLCIYHPKKTDNPKLI